MVRVNSTLLSLSTPHVLRCFMPMGHPACKQRDRPPGAPQIAVSLTYLVILNGVVVDKCCATRIILFPSGKKARQTETKPR
ncbi:hypothetical protein BKA83DRAFT_681678 [Pisolithus microcarpus]|nr:hypothetical protein BKA83DRAFT_681678 [Pisolithus microcarpus]